MVPSALCRILFTEFPSRPLSQFPIIHITSNHCASLCHPFLFVVTTSGSANIAPKPRPRCPALPGTVAFEERVLQAEPFRPVHARWSFGGRSGNGGRQTRRPASMALNGVPLGLEDRRRLENSGSYHSGRRSSWFPLVRTLDWCRGATPNPQVLLREGRWAT